MSDSSDHHRRETQDRGHHRHDGQRRREHVQRGGAEGRGRDRANGTSAQSETSKRSYSAHLRLIFISVTLQTLGLLKLYQ